MRFMLVAIRAVIMRFVLFAIEIIVRFEIAVVRFRVDNLRSENHSVVFRRGQSIVIHFIRKKNLHFDKIF
jgi:hypothetical protein